MENPLDSPIPTPNTVSNKILVQGVLLMLCWLLFFFNWIVFIVQLNQDSHLQGPALIIISILYFPFMLLMLYFLYKLWLLSLLILEGLFWLLRWTLFQTWIKKLRTASSPLAVAFVVQFSLSLFTLYQLLA